jgi:hypothetical protein
MTCTPEEYLEFHEDPARDNAIGEASLYCAACGLPFIPTEPMTQKDDDCLCADCAEAIEKMKEGVIA